MREFPESDAMIVKVPGLEDTTPVSSMPTNETVEFLDKILSHDPAVSGPAQAELHELAEASERGELPLDITDMPG